MRTNYITPSGYAKLLNERDYLVKKERPKVCEVVAWAASLGDRSENADYQYGKKRLREIDRRVRFLNSRLNIALIIDPLKQSAEAIQFGATVELENEEGARKIICIVGADEVDLKLNYYSYFSPIGKACLGKKLGDSALVKSPTGEIEYEITSIKYTLIEIVSMQKEWEL